MKAIQDDKPELAKSCGAEVTINASEQNVPWRILELTGGGAQTAVVVAVARSAFNQAVTQQLAEESVA